MIEPIFRREKTWMKKDGVINQGYSEWLRNQLCTKDEMWRLYQPSIPIVTVESIKDAYEEGGRMSSVIKAVCVRHTERQPSAT